MLVPTQQLQAATSLIGTIFSGFVSILSKSVGFKVSSTTKKLSKSDSRRRSHLLKTFSDGLTSQILKQMMF